MFKTEHVFSNVPALSQVRQVPVLLLLIHKTVLSSGAARISPEEDGNGTGTRMAADGGSDVVDEHGSVKGGEGCFNHIGHRAGILYAGGMADIALAAVGGAALRVGLHALDDL